VLRHSNVQTMQTHYIKTSAKDVRDAMGKLEEKVAQQTAAQILRDSDLTAKPASGALPEIVN
jgi:hypothetical protein